MNAYDNHINFTCFFRFLHAYFTNKYYPLFPPPRPPLPPRVPAGPPTPASNPPRTTLAPQLSLTTRCRAPNNSPSPLCNQLGLALMSLHLGICRAAACSLYFRWQCGQKTKLCDCIPDAAAAEDERAARRVGLTGRPSFSACVTRRFAFSMARKPWDCWSHFLPLSAAGAAAAAAAAEWREEGGKEEEVSLEFS